MQIGFDPILATTKDMHYGTMDPYYKGKLELRPNLSEILPVVSKFIWVHIFLFCAESQTSGSQV